MENHTENQLATVGSLPVGEFFKINPSPSAKVYRRGAYDRSARAYWANDCSDISNGRLLKAGRVVFVGFTY